MCEPSTLDLIREVVTEATDKDQMFTAFDISLQVKELAEERGELVERHRHMKGAIHQEIAQYLDSDLYERQLMDVGAPTKAFVYFPEGQDPSGYRPKKRRDSQAAPVASPLPSVAPSPVGGAPSTQAAPQAAPVASSAPSDDDDDEGDEKDTNRSPDARGTVAVPSYLLRAAGMVAGDTVHVGKSDHNGDECLIVSSDDDGSALVSYTVDKYNNVRITKPRLDSIGSDGTYDFLLQSDRVIIKKH
jgi:hypothetical protein